MQSLFDEKMVLEAKLASLSEQLKELGFSDVKTFKLVDKDGFPLPNVDHYGIVNIKRQIDICKNDLRQVMKKIEQELPAALQSGQRYATKPFALVLGSINPVLKRNDQIVTINNTIVTWDQLKAECTNVESLKILRDREILYLTCSIDVKDLNLSKI